MLGLSHSTVFGPAVATVGIPLSALLGIAFAVILWRRVSLIKVRGGGRPENGREYLLEEEQRGESEVGAPAASPARPALPRSTPRSCAAGNWALPSAPAGAGGRADPADRGEGRRPASRHRGGCQLVPVHRVQVRQLLHGEGRACRSGWAVPFDGAAPLSAGARGREPRTGHGLQRARPIAQARPDGDALPSDDPPTTLPDDPPVGLRWLRCRPPAGRLLDHRLRAAGLRGRVRHRLEGGREGHPARPWRLQRCARRTLQPPPVPAACSPATRLAPPTPQRPPTHPPIPCLQAPSRRLPSWPAPRRRCCLGTWA